MDGVSSSGHGLISRTSTTFPSFAASEFCWLGAKGQSNMGGKHTQGPSTDHDQDLPEHSADFAAACRWRRELLPARAKNSLRPRPCPDRFLHKQPHSLPSKESIVSELFQGKIVSCATDPACLLQDILSNCLDRRPRSDVLNASRYQGHSCELQYLPV